MSQFNKYARKFDEIARKAFEEYGKAAEREQYTEQQKALYPRKANNVTAEYLAKSARAEADHAEATADRKAVQDKMTGEYNIQIEALRGELEREVDKAFFVDPAQIDNATLELLKSGICTPNEYADLLSKAADSGNVTMIRLIGKYADDAAKKATEDAGGYVGDPTAQGYRAVSIQSRNYNGKRWLEAFDYMADVYKRACRNPYMIDHWGELTAEAVENF